MTPSPSAPPVIIYEAICTPDGSGGVRQGRALTRAEAISHRMGGGDVVVCGSDPFANNREARAIESAVGPWAHHPAHVDAAGPLALPHVQQRVVPPGPAGHTFYETDVRKAIS
jgi:hypothetical protein